MSRAQTEGVGALYPRPGLVGEMPGMAPSAGISATGDIAVGVAADYEYAATEVGHGEVGTEIGEHAAQTVERLPHEFRPTGFVPRRRRLMSHDDYGKFRGMGGDGIGYLPHDTAERTCCGELAMIKMQRLAAIGFGTHGRAQIEGTDACLPLSGDALLLRLRLSSCRRRLSAGMKPSPVAAS